MCRIDRARDKWLLASGGHGVHFERAVYMKESNHYGVVLQIQFGYGRRRARRLGSLGSQCSNKLALHTPLLIVKQGERILVTSGTSMPVISWWDL